MGGEGEAEEMPIRKHPSHSLHDAHGDNERNLTAPDLKQQAVIRHAARLYSTLTAYCMGIMYVCTIAIMKMSEPVRATKHGRVAISPCDVRAEVDS